MAGSAMLSPTVIAVSEGTLDEDKILGRGATFTHPDEERKLTDFLRSWAENGLDVNDLPEARQPVHVFQSACASVRERKHLDANGHRSEVRSDEVEHAPLVCSYQITLVEWHEDERVIEHEKGLRVEFDKRTSNITFTPLDGYTPGLARLEDAILDHWQANQATIPGPKIRNAVRDQLERIGAQNLRRKAGGLYFVASEYDNKPTKPVLEGLKGVLEDLYGERADFFFWPFANDEGIRAMVRKHFTLNAGAELQKLVEKCINRVREGKGRGVREEMILNVAGDRRKVLAAITQFKELVALETTELDAKLKDLDEAFDSLQTLAAS